MSRLINNNRMKRQNINTAINTQHTYHGRAGRYIYTKLTSYVKLRKMGIIMPSVQSGKYLKKIRNICMAGWWWWWGGVTPSNTS